MGGYNSLDVAKAIDQSGGTQGGSNVPWWVGPAVSVAGTAVDAWSQNQTNKANANNVQKQIDFQREQANTTWQRAVADMQAAGLNPALAYEKGGNPAATGAAAQAQPIMQNTMSKFATAVDIYNSYANGAAQRNLMEQQATATQADAQLKQTQRALLAPEGILSENPEYRAAYFKRGMARLSADTFTADKTPERFAADIASTGAGTAKAQADAKEAAARTTLDQQLFQNAWFRKNIAPYLNSTAATARTFTDVAKGYNYMGAP